MSKSVLKLSSYLARIPVRFVWFAATTLLNSSIGWASVSSNHEEARLSTAECIWYLKDPNKPRSMNTSPSLKQGKSLVGRQIGLATTSNERSTNSGSWGGLTRPSGEVWVTKGSVESISTKQRLTWAEYKIVWHLTCYLFEGDWSNNLAEWLACPLPLGQRWHG
jgi:hypothetical protein